MCKRAYLEFFELVFGCLQPIGTLWGLTAPLGTLWGLTAPLGTLSP